MKRFRLYFDKEKEEVWLNKMSQRGWAMTGFIAGLYTFMPCEPGKYIYRVDMRGEAGRTPIWRNDYQEYIEFVEETGAEYVCRWAWWLIFRREATKGEFTLYTDAESHIALYKRIRWMFLFFGMMELSLALSNVRSLLDFWDKFGYFDSMGFVLFAAVLFAWFIAVGFFLMSLKFTLKMRKLRR